MRNTRTLKQVLLRHRIGFLLLALLLGPVGASGEPFALENDLQAWQSFTARTHITRRVQGYVDVQSNLINLTNQPHLSANKENLGQLLLRPALGFKLGRGVSLWQGYGWTPSFDPEFRSEHRIWQQVLVEKRFENLRNLSISSRTRFETRRIADADGESFRIRSQFRAMLPIGQTPWSLVTHVEPFVNLNTVGNGPRSGFNQSRVFVGINRKITPSLNAEIGYLNQYVNVPGSSRDRMNHVILATVNFVPTFPGIDLKCPKMDEPTGELSQDEPENEASPIAQALGSLTTPDIDKEAEPLTLNEPQLEILPIVLEQKSAGEPLEALSLDNERLKTIKDI